jgi:hypothetical protein
MRARHAALSSSILSARLIPMLEPPAAGSLMMTGKPSLVSAETILFGSQQHPGWSGQFRAHPAEFGAKLVHAQGRRQNAAACVRNAQYLKRPLQYTILPTASVNDIENAIKLPCSSSISGPNHLVANIKTDGIHPFIVQRKRLQDGLPTLERNLSLGCHPPHQDRNSLPNASGFC